MSVLSSLGSDPQINERHGVIIPMISRLSSNYSDASPFGGETARELYTEKELEPLRKGNSCRMDNSTST